MERKLKSKMLNGWQIDELCQRLSDRFTAEELVEALGLSVDDIIQQFLEECVDKHWEDYL